MTYRAPVADHRFILDHVVGYGALAETGQFAEADAETTDAILAEAAKLSEEVLAPLNREGDLHPARLENGVVRSSPGFAEGYRAIAEGGWVGMAGSPDYGGMGLPTALHTAVFEMIGSGCMALELCPVLALGAIEALQSHASDELRDLYLPKLISGEWTGTMNLTEPQAGSDVGALRTKAEPLGDGSYAITGQKIFITWGDHDMTENVCHLVLARLPGAAPGTKGISLFMVPKRLPDADGNPGPANDLRVVSLEHKLGIHGSPTCVMAYEGARGWLVGPENGGMACMFTMMNSARLHTGVQGVSIAERATQSAVAYAMTRQQGRSTIANGHGTIIDHADVRRMLTTMKAETFAARAIALSCAVAIDMAHATGDAAWAARAAFLTPIVKAHCSDTGVKVASLGVQVHGGMGFIEETGAAQYLRDARIVPIYEGTNGIQAMDLVGRKLMDGGAQARQVLNDAEETANAFRACCGDIPEEMTRAVAALKAATAWMLERTDLNDRFAGAAPYLTAFARVLGADFHLRAAMAEGGRGPRMRLARAFVTRILPEVHGLLAEARAGAEDLYALSIEDLTA